MSKIKFSKDVQDIMPSLRSVKSLADKYSTSLSATAIRFIEYTLEPCTLVLIESRKVRWKMQPRNFRSKITDCYAFEISDSERGIACDLLSSHPWTIDSSIDYII